jgi:hypothetical protein
VGNEHSGSTSIRRTREDSSNRGGSTEGICFDIPDVSASMIVESSWGRDVEDAKGFPGKEGLVVTMTTLDNNNKTHQLDMNSSQLEPWTPARTFHVIRDRPHRHLQFWCERTSCRFLSHPSSHHLLTMTTFERGLRLRALRPQKQQHARGIDHQHSDGNTSANSCARSTSTFERR